MEMKKWADSVFEKLNNKIKLLAIKSYDKIPCITSNGQHDDQKGEGINNWTNGFWPAMMILMYSQTKHQQYLDTARHCMDMMDEALMNFDHLHHDVGFMWNISSGADYRFTGDKKERNRSLVAANHLMGRFNSDGGFIRAWNGGEDVKGWAIIDCMMNIPLLYRASEETEDDRFAMVANKHADKTMKFHIRADGSCHHIVEYDFTSGEFVRTHAGQGCALNSSWTRGQAWAVYGFALAYKFTQNEEYLNTAKRAANYFIVNAQYFDWVPPCDFKQPAEEKLYDTSAGAIAACGIMQIADSLEGTEKDMYKLSAFRLLQAIEKYCDWTDENDAILQMSTGAYTLNHHVNYIFGDYFFAEGICRLCGNDINFMW